MKTKDLKTAKRILALLVIMVMVIVTSCQKDDIDDAKDSIIPNRFKVDLPNSISSENVKKSVQVDTLQGDGLYEMLRLFISVGEGAAELTQDVMFAIALHNLNRPLEISFISDDDGREKHISIIENVSFDGKQWQYRLTLTDVEEAVAKDYSTNIGMQVFWNLSPIEGISILNFNNINRNTEEKFKDTYYRVDYSETGSLGYDQHMTVTITGLPVPPPETDLYSISTLKMFAGRSGDLISIYGNSEHPNAKFFTEEAGFNWAFVAAGSESLDIAVAEVGLPPISLSSDNRETLLEEYSIYNVLRDQILMIWPTIDPDILHAYLIHAQAPGYFNSNGFVQGGTSPSGSFSPLETTIESLSPYNPQHISGLIVSFQE